MRTALKRIDDRLTVELPTEAEEAGLSEGAEVEVTMDGDKVVVVRRRVTLAEILEELERKGPPPVDEEWENMEPVGSDVW